MAILVEALTRAHDYLFEVRRFRSISQGVDIVLRNPFPIADLGNLAGSYVDQISTYPYIVINLPLIQTTQQLEAELKPYVDRGIDQNKLDKMRSRNLAEQNGNRDSLHATCAHELFHVIQEEYHNAVFSTAIRTDKDIYFVTKLSVGNLLEYLRYARPLFTKVNVAYKKEIEKYESTFTATIRDVFSTETSFDPYQVPAFTDVLHRSAKKVGGPASTPVTFKGKDPGLSKGVIPGVYTGRLFVSFESNLSMKWPSTVTVTVRGDQTVLIDFVGEITEGALVATDKQGHYQFLEKTMTSDGAAYRPMEGGLALFSEDGSLVFTFIPTRLKRSYGSK